MLHYDMGKLKLIITLFFLLFIQRSSFAQMEQMQAAYIYNFATMTSYPASMQTGNFLIVVIGNTNVFPALEAIAKTKKIGTQAITVKRIASSAEIGNAHMVFVSDDMKSKFADVVSNTASSHTVVITESPGLAKKGAIFNFVIIDSKLKFEVNESKANAKGVKLSVNLIKLGIPVQ